MSFLFGGKQKTPAELMKEYKRNIDRSVREIEREKTKLQQQEKKIIVEIKKMAKDGQMAVVKTMAKDLVRTRAQVTKFYQMKCQMQAVGLKLQTIKSTQSMTEAMKGATKAMKGMNAKVNAPAMAKILKEFEKESSIMDDKQEMMDETIDEAFEADDEETQIEEVVGQVLAEIGIDLNGELCAPSAGGAATAKVGEADLDDELDARLRALKGPYREREREKEREASPVEARRRRRRKICSGANAVNEEDPERDRATQVQKTGEVVALKTYSAVLRS